MTGCALGAPCVMRVVSGSTGLGQVFVWRLNKCLDRVCHEHEEDTAQPASLCNSATDDKLGAAESALWIQVSLGWGTHPTALCTEVQGTEI